MTAARPETGSISPRRTPSQQRSRRRVERILDAAAELIVEHGVEQLSTKAIAQRAEVSVASLYQYFSHKDDVILALVQRDADEMDARAAAGIDQVAILTIRSLVEATMRAFVEVHHQRPAFGMIWWRGRTNAAVVDFCREHNKQIAAALITIAREHELTAPGTPDEVAEFAVEIGDRVFQLAFEHDLSGDQWTIDEGVELVAGYLQRYSNAAD